MRKTPWNSLIILLTCLMKVAEIQAQCERPNVGENMVMIDDSGQQTFPNGSTVTFKCSTGYQPVVSRTITCVGTNWTNLELTCTMVECETPNIKNAVRVEGKLPPYGYKNFVRYQCNEGYTMNGTGHLVCEVNGWNPPPPECISNRIPDPPTTSPPSDAQCERPNVGENMVMIDDLGQQTFPNGSTVTFKCSTGYQPVVSSASRTITCVGTNWTNLELTCTKKSCGSLPDLPNGKYTYPDGILFGATAVAQCNEGYLLVGEKTRNCRDNGWDGRDPVCEAVKCLPPPTIQNGTFDPVEESYNYNEAVTYSCSVVVECETPNIKNAVRVEGKPPPYGYKNFVRYQCNEGYTMNGTGHLVCEVNGWNPPPPECISNRIPDPPTTSPPSDGNCVKPSVLIIAVAVSIVVLLGPKNYHSG
ncbi:hypothetical protein PGIGA_G00076700 [Pangasianodon gigas]|uniref:Uncharacterized protein n=1 Tax=Pangasianodon gigas TaxID=30993 RepID=A0ACC5X9C5_PANGG|nr:hypothetical protein [Pangasianodon gigas]